MPPLLSSNPHAGNKTPPPSVQNLPARLQRRGKNENERHPFAPPPSTATTKKRAPIIDPPHLHANERHLARHTSLAQLRSTNTPMAEALLGGNPSISWGNPSSIRRGWYRFPSFPGLLRHAWERTKIYTGVAIVFVVCQQQEGMKDDFSPGPFPRCAGEAPPKNLPEFFFVFSRPPPRPPSWQPLPRRRPLAPGGSPCTRSSARGRRSTQLVFVVVFLAYFSGARGWFDSIDSIAAEGRREGGQRELFVARGLSIAGCCRQVIADLYCLYVPCAFLFPLGELQIVTTRRCYSTPRFVYFVQIFGHVSGEGDREKRRGISPSLPRRKKNESVFFRRRFSLHPSRLRGRDFSSWRVYTYSNAS